MKFYLNFTNTGIHTIECDDSVEIYKKAKMISGEDLIVIKDTNGCTIIPFCEEYKLKEEKVLEVYPIDITKIIYVNKLIVINYLEKIEGKKIEEVCKNYDNYTIIWVNPILNCQVGIKYEILVWDKEFQEILVHEVDRISKGHPMILIAEKRLSFCKTNFC